MNEQRLMEIKVRADHATDGPWEIGYDVFDSETMVYIGDSEIGNEMCRVDAEFIAHARNDVPELLNKVWEQNTELKMLRISRKMWKELDAKRAAENAELQSKLDHVELAEAKARVENEELRADSETLKESHFYYKKLYNDAMDEILELNKFLHERGVKGRGNPTIDVAMGHIQKLESENERLREALEVIGTQLITIRGTNNSHDNDITGLCIQTRQALDGEYIEVP